MPAPTITSSAYLPLWCENNNTSVQTINNLAGGAFTAFWAQWIATYKATMYGGHNQAPFGTAQQGASPTTFATKTDGNGVPAYQYVNGSYISQGVQGDITDGESESVESTAPQLIQVFWPGFYNANLAGQGGTNTAARLV